MNLTLNQNEKTNLISTAEVEIKEELDLENELGLKTPESLKPAKKRKKKPKNPEHISKGLKIELYPTFDQAKELDILIGGVRWVWNWALDLQESHYALHQKKLSEIELSRQFTLLKKETIDLHKRGEVSPLLWISVLPRTSITQVFDHLKKAWDAYFDSLSGKRPGPKVNRPTFKAKHFAKKALSFQIDPRHEDPLFHPGFQEKPTTKINLKTKTQINLKTQVKPQAYLKVPILGKIKASFDPRVQPFAAHISTLAISKKGDKWYASLTCVDVDKNQWMKSKSMPEITSEFKQDPYGVFALDAAISHRGTGFNGKEFSKLGRLDKPTNKTNCFKSIETICLEKLQQEKMLATEKRRKRYQRSYSRKMEVRKTEQGLDPKKSIPKGTRLAVSNRQLKTKNHIAKIAEHQANQRLDQAHKFTTNIVRKNHTIVVEDLNLTAMKKGLNKAFRRAYNLATPGQIIHMLQYKCEWYGRDFIKVDRFFASSKICSNCSFKNKDLKLSDATWICPSCGVSHDRDENAAVNLWLEGLRLAGLTLPVDFDVKNIKTIAKSSPTLRSRESYEHGGGGPDLDLSFTKSNKHPVKCLSSSHSKA